MGSYRLARDLAPNEALAWLSTPDADLTFLRRDASIAEARLLKAALTYGRSSPEYAAASSASSAAEAALAAAEGRVDLTIESTLSIDNVLKAGEEYMVVRGVSRDNVEVGRAALGSSRSAHATGDVIYKADLRVEATFNFELIVDNGGSPIGTGDKGDVVLPFAGRISGVKLVADQAGDLVVDFLRAPYPSVPVASIVGGTIPFLSGSRTYSDDVLTGWDPQCAANDVVRVLVVSAALVEMVTVSITYTTTTRT